MKKSQLKPWLNGDGSVKSDAELRKEGRQWPPSVWEDYLATLEVRRKEDIVLPPSVMDKFSSQKHIRALFAMTDDHPLLKLVLNTCVHKLTPKQRRVIVSRYWHGKSITEIAKEVGISKQAVSKTTHKALTNLKASMTDASFVRQVVLVNKTLAA